MEDNEDIDFVASEHDRLVSAVTKLDKTQHITAPSRSEPTNLHSEFSLVKGNKKINLKNVAKVFEDTAHHVKVSRKLRKSTDANKVLPKPLEKPQAERIKRSTGYEKTKEKVGRWDPVVARNRTVDYVSFPLKQTNNKMQPTHDFLSKLKLKSPLEKELEEVDPQPFVEESDEEEQSYPMTYQEMLEHRQQIAKVRAQQSYKAAKAKRQSKIKSKKYHRILKKERLKLQLKEFEELQKTDPEEALKKLEALEKARALERHTLRHKNTGKWAKNKLVRAKYDKEVRQQLSEQLSVSRNLTKKVQNDQNSDEESDNDEAMQDVALSQDPMNPWMTKRGDKSNIDAEFDFGYKKYLKDRMFKRKHDSDSDSNEEENEDTTLSALKNSIGKLYQEKKEEDTGKDSSTELNQKNSQNIDTTPVEKQKIKKKGQSNKKIVKNKKSTVVATSSWVVESIDNSMNEEVAENISSAFETLESEVTSKLDRKLAKMRKVIARFEKPSRLKRQNKQGNEEIDNLEYLKLKKKKITPVIDEELIETNSKSTNDYKSIHKQVSATADNSQTSISTARTTIDQISDIDPNRFIEAKPTYLNTALPGGGNEFDNLDDDEQVVPKVSIEEVFEEDDVVASFRQEKEDEINKDMSKEIDLSLPGWGSWGGKGVEAPRRRRNRFIVKPAPETPRRDENKGDIIIKEVKDPKLAVHKVADLPFPFSSIKDFEASIRAPLGNTFIPEKAHKKLIRPSVITKAGAIIEPMDEEELLVKRNRNFNNNSVIKLLGQKNL